MAKMVYRQNVIRGGGGYAEVRNQSSMLRRAKKSLSRFDKNPADEDALDTVIRTLNDISDMLKGRQPKDEVENECECEDGDECDCDETAHDPKATPDAKTQSAIVRDWESNRGTAAVVNALQRKSYRENHSDRGHSREMTLVRNSAGVSFLSDEDLVEIAARNARTRKR